jgi:uncharacterized membrane protein SpoIIM required for sporulation/uncharacterized RDD family membrane protein YckC
LIIAITVIKLESRLFLRCTDQRDRRWSLIEVPCATVAQRLMAGIIDLMIISVISMPIFIFTAKYSLFVQFSLATSSAVVLMTLYYSLTEGALSTSPGKKMMNLYILDSDSFRPISYRQALVRNIIRMADASLLYLPMVLNKDRRRIGDGAAGTVVVSKRRLSVRVISPEEYKKRKMVEGGAYSMDLAVAEALIDKIKEKASTFPAEKLENTIKYIERGIKIDEIKRRSMETIGSDDPCSILAFSVLAGYIPARSILSQQEFVDILEKASLFAFSQEERRSLSIKAGVLRGIDEAERYTKPFRLNILLRSMWDSPRLFREITPFFLASFFILLFSAFFAMWMPSDIVSQLKELMGKENISMPGPFVTAIMIVLNNIKVWLLLYGGGPLIIASPSVTAINGVILGSVGGLLMREGRALDFLSAVLPHGVMEVTAILIASSIGIKMGLSLIFPGEKSRYESLKEVAMRYSDLVVLSAVLLFIAGFVEAFITPILMHEHSIAITVSILEIIVLYLFLLKSK